MAQVASTLWHVSAASLARGTTINAHQEDIGYMHMVRQALANGVPFLETLLHADWLDASRGVGGPTRLSDRLIEVIFEEVRTSEFPGRPARVGSVHLFRTYAAAVLFNARFRGGNAHVLVCHVVGATPFDSYMDWVNPGVELAKPIGPQLDAMRDRARKYWSGLAPTEAQYPEALVAGVVIIDGHADLDGPNNSEAL